MRDRNYPSFVPAIALVGILFFVGIILRFISGPVYWSGFFAMMLFYGIIFYLGSVASRWGSTKKSEDFLLAGRNMPLWIAIFTMSATWIGGGYINGTAESTSSFGLAWVQPPWGYAISLILGGIFFARKMRRYEFTTMLDPLEMRYGKKMAAILFLPALSAEIFWSAAILTALGTTFGTVLGLNSSTAIIISGVVSVAYTTLGGLWAVALTDILQLILLFLGLLIVIPFALPNVGGWDSAWTTYQDSKGILSNLLPPLDAWKYPEWGNYYWQWWDSALLLIFGGIPWQVYFQRVLAAKNENTAMWLSIVAGFISILAAIPAIAIGVIGDVASWTDFGIDPPAEAALILPYVVRYLTNPIVATIALGAIAAAVMSSVDSSLLSTSSMLTWNVYRPLIKPEIESREMAKIVKWSLWGIGIAAILLALTIKSIYVLWFLCSDFVYTILFPQLVTVLFDKKANTYGSIAGFVVSFILRFGGGEPALGIPRLLPYPMIDDAGVVLFPFKTLAMACGLITIIVVSRATQNLCPTIPLRSANEQVPEVEVKELES